MQKLKMHSVDGVARNIEKIGELFPNAVTEVLRGGKVERAVDFDVLRQELSDVIVEGREERYQFTWPDKRKAILAANAPVSAALRPVEAESVGRDGTPGGFDSENLYIEGDNLDVLKLLRETYLGKVKMIYIDPPYNTGGDFIYNDKFAAEKGEYMANSGQFDEEGNRMEKNLESNGRFHTDWLNMIYPRLKVAKDLLTYDGVIFISIDDNELHNLRKLCDNIFGEENFYTQIIVQSNKRGHTYKQIAKTHEYILIYIKSSDTEFNELTKSDDINDLNLIDEISSFNVRELRNRNPKFGRFNRPNLFYPFYVNPLLKDKDGFCPISLTKSNSYYVDVLPLNSSRQESCWRWGKDKVSKNITLNTLTSNLVAKEKADGSYGIYEKYRKSTYKPKTIWDDVSIINEKGTVELGNLGLATFFDFPKPIALIKRVIEIGTNEEDIILDFFSGSATTAHAVMQLNAEDGGKRKFIMVQIPEICDEKSEAFKAGYKNVCEIGKERIRRAGKKIKEESPLTTQDLDVGFRCLRLDTSNMKDVYYRPDELRQEDLFAAADNVKEGRGPEDLLFQAMLELGAELSAKIETAEIAGKRVFNVADNYLLACFDTEVTDETVAAMAKMKPQYAVLRDNSMKSDSVAANFEQIFKTYSPDTTLRVL